MRRPWSARRSGRRSLIALFVGLARFFSIGRGFFRAGVGGSRVAGRRAYLCLHSSRFFLSAKIRACIVSNLRRLESTNQASPVPAPNEPYQGHPRAALPPATLAIA